MEENKKETSFESFKQELEFYAAFSEEGLKVLYGYLKDYKYLQDYLEDETGTFDPDSILEAFVEYPNGEALELHYAGKEPDFERILSVGKEGLIIEIL